MIRLQGTLTAVGPITANYPRYGGRLPRAPDGAALLYGGTFRGVLRKAAFRAIRNGLANARGVAPDTIFSLAASYMLCYGKDIDGVLSDVSITPVSEQALRQTNPLLDLFGHEQMAGRLSVSTMTTPASNIMAADAPMLTDMFEADAGETRFLSPDGRRALDARPTQSDNATDSAVPLEFEAIAPGARLTQTITVRDGRPADLALLVVACMEMARSPFMGAHSAHGFGEFSGQWTVRSWPENHTKPITLGHLGFNRDGLDAKGNDITSVVGEFIRRIGEFDFSAFAPSHLSLGGT